MAWSIGIDRPMESSASSRPFISQNEVAGNRIISQNDVGTFPIYSGEGIEACKARLEATIYFPKCRRQPNYFPKCRRQPIYLMKIEILWDI